MRWTLLVLGLMATPLASAKPPAPAPCSDSRDAAIVVLPRSPDVRRPVRLIYVAEAAPADGTRFSLTGPTGEVPAGDLLRLGGPPYGLVATTTTLPAGRYELRVMSQKGELACERFEVRRKSGAATRRRVGEDPVWEVRNRWGQEFENLYSLFIEALFEAPVDSEPIWRPLHVVLREQPRNLLFDYLNMGEDGPGKSALHLEPDCADFPVVLRGYFAWKFGLPFAYRQCSRGASGRAPTCSDDVGSQLRFAEKPTRVRAFEKFIRWRAAGSTHSASGRAALEADDTDLYPVELKRRSLRPGTVYADPYGHILMIQKWIPQRASSKAGDASQGPDVPGILFAVDAQPDGTVGRRRFWEGSFLFPRDGDVDGAGFKRHRPVRIRRRPAQSRADAEARLADAGEAALEVLKWEIRPYTNVQIRGTADWGDFSTEQGKLAHQAFYDRMDALINPVPMRPEIALKAVMDALTEEVRRRVQSVGNAEEWHASNRGRSIPMPEASKIFQTVGPWEDYATPSRDMRLLIAIDTVLAFPGRIVRSPERFLLASGEPPEAVKTRIEKALLADARARKFDYARTDGSTFTLTVGDVLDRKRAFEMTYNPNDCLELRWGALEGTAELAPCKRRAPADQVRRMESYRSWFAKRRRPGRE